MSSDQAKDALKMSEIAISALESIQDLTTVGVDKAPDALQTIGAIVGSLLEGFAGKTTPDVVEAELHALVSRATSAETRIDEKFDHGDSSNGNDDGTNGDFS
jgi:hypothetical protein